MDSQSIISEVGLRHNMDGASVNLKRAWEDVQQKNALIGVNSVIFPNTKGILKRASWLIEIELQYGIVWL